MGPETLFQLLRPLLSLPSELRLVTAIRGLSVPGTAPTPVGQSRQQVPLRVPLRGTIRVPLGVL